MTKARNIANLLSTANNKIAGSNLDVDFEDIRDQFIQYKNEWNDPFSDRKGIVSVDTPEEALDLILSRPDDMYATDKDYKQKVLNILKDARRNPALF